MIREVDAETAIHHMLERDERMVELGSWRTMPSWYQSSALLAASQIVAAVSEMLRDGRLVGGIGDDGQVWLRLPDGHWPDDHSRKV